MVEDDNEILAYYQKPAIVDESQLGQFAPYPAGPAIIIAPQEFHSAFPPYADWMTDQGIRVYLITPRQSTPTFLALIMLKRCVITLDTVTNLQVTHILSLAVMITLCQ